MVFCCSSPHTLRETSILTYQGTGGPLVCTQPTYGITRPNMGGSSSYTDGGPGWHLVLKRKVKILRGQNYCTEVSPWYCVCKLLKLFSRTVKSLEQHNCSRKGRRVLRVAVWTLEPFFLQASYPDSRLLLEDR